MSGNPSVADMSKLQLHSARVSEWWKREKKSSRFRNILMYLIFVGIAAIFWFVLALNDSVQRTVDVAVNVTGVPDSVTFIHQPPEEIHVSIRDKGTSLLRNVVFNRPAIDINFKEYACGNDGVMVVSKNDLMTILRKTFGASAQLSVASIDSIRATYTDRPGKRVPIVAQTDVTAASGYVVGRRARLSQSYTLIYGPESVIDTVSRIYTERFSRRGMTESVSSQVELIAVPGTRLIPDRIQLTVPVEPLVNKQAQVNVDVINAPDVAGILLFPQKVTVSYYVPMSDFNKPQSNLEVVADYSQRGRGLSGRIPVRLARAPKECINVRVLADSLEYTIVK